MRLLISDVSELKLPARFAEIQQFFAAIGYQITSQDDDLLLTSKFGKWQLHTPATFVRYDRDHFLSIQAEDWGLDLPFVSGGEERELR